jgi:hypothetical protein
MGVGSGIAAQAGFVSEGTVGTATTVTNFPEFNSEGVNFVKGLLQGQGLRAGGSYDRALRRVVSTVGAAGPITMDHATKKFNFFWRHMLGSTPTFTQLGSTTAYTGLHVPGPIDGKSFTYQKGVPQTDGTVKPFTFNGGKVTQWTFSVTDQLIAQLALTMDFWNVVTATGLAAASYPAGNEVFNFSQAALSIGGTASTSSGVTTVSGGSAATTLFKGFSLTGTNPMATARRGLGNAGVKKEQIENGIRTLAGQLDGEFTSESEIWDVMKADTSTVLHFTLTGSVIASTYHNTIDIICPAAKFDTSDISVAGPDIVQQSVPFAVLDDGSGSNPAIQVTITSTDTDAT